MLDILWNPGVFPSTFSIFRLAPNKQGRAFHPFVIVVWVIEPRIMESTPSSQPSPLGGNRICAAPVGVEFSA
jgi:hypothetical protein